MEETKTGTDFLRQLVDITEKKGKLNILCTEVIAKDTYFYGYETRLFKPISGSSSLPAISITHTTRITHHCLARHGVIYALQGL